MVIVDSMDYFGYKFLSKTYVTKFEVIVAQ